MMIDETELVRFCEESNRIEGIDGVSQRCLEAHYTLLNIDEIHVSDMETFVEEIQPGAKLRRSQWQNVRIGSHCPPQGGPGVVDALRELLRGADDNPYGSYATHIAYETLHPFMDGNGRSGRALWAWMQVKNGTGLHRGFLHEFYYQTLRNSDGRR